MRNQTREVKIGSVTIGGSFPVAIQSMTNTPTADITKTVTQINQLAQAGCEIIRVAVPDKKSAQALKKIKAQTTLPLVADIHFDFRLALLAMDNGADKIRINPGNLGGEDKLIQVIKKAKKTNTPIRIGVNAGSLEQKILKKYKKPTPAALVESMLNTIHVFEKENFKQLVLAVKHHDPLFVIEAYQEIAKKTNYPLHLGVTESGTFLTGTVKSSVALGTLLAEGIGDTLRVSLSADPVKEIAVAKKILEAVSLKKNQPRIISCPTCGRTVLDVIEIAQLVEEKTSTLKKPITIAVMGCLVNGPGEAKEADLGICGIDKDPDSVMFFKKGKLQSKIPKKDLVEFLLAEVAKI